MKLLKKYGVEAYYSRCATLTFEKRETEPLSPKVFIVGLTRNERHIIPPDIRKDAIVVEQSKISLPGISSELRHQLASHVLEQYRTRAELVITSKIHCAMPCIAMGIPVVFLYDKSKADDYRVKIIEDLIGINYVSTRSIFGLAYKYIDRKRINWRPAVVDIEDLKNQIRSDVRDRIRQLL